MSRYHQFCGVARALELVGDRWTLLVVRELLVGPRRYTDLRAGLPGIASNLLAHRLSDLQDAGLIERRLAAKGQVYALTPRGEGLRGVVHELARWAAPSMAAGPAPDDSFQPQWLAVALEAFLDPARPARELRLAAETPEARVVVAFGPAGARVDPAGRGADVTLTGPGPLVLGVASGAVPLAVALARGLEVQGDEALLEGLVTAG